MFMTGPLIITWSQGSLKSMMKVVFFSSLCVNQAFTLFILHEHDIYSADVFIY